MRIIGGRWRGRILKSPVSSKTRPTLDRVRETVFNIIEHNPAFGPQVIPDARVLDVFAGTGALGIEALSRGAIKATFIEWDVDAFNVLQDNTRTMDVTLMHQDVFTVGSAPHPHSLIFMDAPYGEGLTEKALAHLYEREWFTKNAVLIIEVGKKEPFTTPAFLEIQKEKSIGPARFIMGRV